jgi:DNA-binding IclR family transcriptional regulator
MKNREWTFLSNHGRVLAYIAKHPQSLTQEIAQEADLSIAGVQKIITDLEKGNYLARRKVGRRNHYTIRPELPMRHRLEREYSVGDVLAGIGYNAQKMTGEDCKMA